MATIDNIGMDSQTQRFIKALVKLVYKLAVAIASVKVFTSLGGLASVYKIFATTPH